jgi:RNA polymerase sigma-70 factor (ECF subfamily)
VSDDPVSRFEALILPHLDAAYSFARYLLRDEHEAQDAVQEAALRAFRAFDTYRGGDARSWFLAIVRNLCLTWMRRRSTEPIAGIAGQPLVDSALEPRAADAAAIAASDAAVIRRAVAELPAEFREAIILRELHGFAYAEIGRVLEIPIGTVMSRLSRARRILADKLGGVIREVG